jgi:hypothetical protein
MCNGYDRTLPAGEGRRLEMMTLGSDAHLITKSMHLLFFPATNATTDDTEEALERI